MSRHAPSGRWPRTWPRKYFFAAVSLYLLFVGSRGSAAASEQTSVDARIENKRRFARLLKQRKLAAAERFVPYFSSPDEAERELLAQFYLMTCRPRLAISMINRISSAQRQKLFKATLLALVSTVRNHRLAVSKNDAPKLSTPPKAIALVREAVDLGEIWNDEWEGLRLGSTLCAHMPAIKDQESRSVARNAARELFDQIPSDDFKRDFNLVALALDVGAAIPGASGILHTFKSEYSNPYYQRLLALTEHQASKDQVTISAVSKNELVLSELNLTKTTVEPRAVQVPMLIQEASLP